jgi:hypothetical protein
MGTTNKARGHRCRKPRHYHVEALTHADLESFYGGGYQSERERNYHYLPDAAKIARRTDNRAEHRGWEGNRDRP